MLPSAACHEQCRPQTYLQSAAVDVSSRNLTVEARHYVGGQEAEEQLFQCLDAHAITTLITARFRVRLH